MFKQLLNLFKSPRQSVVVGALYQFKTEKGNPFKTELMLARVKDFRDGWVLYSIQPEGGLFQNESKKVDLFLRLYEPLER